MLKFLVLQGALYIYDISRLRVKAAKDCASAWPWLTACSVSIPAKRIFSESWHCEITLMLSETLQFLLKSGIQNMALPTKPSTRFRAHLVRKYLQTKPNEK
jgi:hypothetical protein